jgi:phosphoserine phosphatase
LPLLKIVSHPIAVDPDATLQAHAVAAGWPIISLRNHAKSSTMSNLADNHA